jgi:regulator of nucleoside diphosphate kinase
MSTRTLDLIGSWRTDRLLLTEHDARRLCAALDPRLASGGRLSRAEADALEALATALESAVLVPSHRIPPDVVTMRSRLVLKDTETGARRVVVLSYPEESQPHLGHVSVLTPVGVALLGLSQGAVVGWPLPSGRTAVLRVEEVQYQPEAATEFHL